MTTKNNFWKAPIANRPQELIFDNKKAVFTWDGSIVKAGHEGRTKRVNVANAALKIGMNRVNFISIHFDVLGDQTLEGTRIITGKNARDLSVLLWEELEKERRGSNSSYPVLVNGDKAHGIHHYHVLGDTNHVKQKTLLELGNFKNERDLWRIRDYRVRENYAQIITRALINLNKQPIRQQR